MSGSELPNQLGADFAGVVSAVGPDTTRFTIGDEVMGSGNPMRGNAYAEWLVANEASCVAKPATIDFEEAAGAPIPAVAALQSLRDAAKLRTGQRVLINGCTGGVGIFAVPLAKEMGLHVTGVCSADQAALASELGADRVLDHRATDVRDLDERFDGILELSGKLPFGSCRHLLTSDGTYVNFIPDPTRHTEPATGGGPTEVSMMSQVNAEDLQIIADHLAAGSIRTVIHRRFPLADAAEAHRVGEAGGATGRLVLVP